MRRDRYNRAKQPVRLIVGAGCEIDCVRAGFCTTAECERPQSIYHERLAARISKLSHEFAASELHDRFAPWFENIDILPDYVVPALVFIIERRKLTLSGIVLHPPRNVGGGSGPSTASIAMPRLKS
jgi:hypothetical protein